MQDLVVAMNTAFGEYSFVILHTRDAAKAKDAALQALNDAGYAVVRTGPRPCTICGQPKIRASEAMIAAAEEG